MRKSIYLGTLLAVLMAGVLTSQTRVVAHNTGDVVRRIGPGSSIGIMVRDSDSGIVVQSVRTETPAARAGMKEGDIVTEFDGERTRSTAQFTRLVRETAPGTMVAGETVSSSGDVVRELREAGPGASVDIRVTRDRKPVTLTAKMPERPRAVERRGARAI